MSTPPIKIQVIKYMLMAKDMQRAVNFYNHVFGLTPSFQSDHWTELPHNQNIIALHGGWDGSDNPTGLSIQTADVHATADRIEHAGGLITNPPHQRPNEPIILGHARDTEGNEFSITQWVG